MTKWAVDVRYPGVPLDVQAPAADLGPGVDIASMTVCGPHYTTLHMVVETIDLTKALEIGKRAADRVARAIGLPIHLDTIAAVQLPGDQPLTQRATTVHSNTAHHRTIVEPASGQGYNLDRGWIDEVWSYMGETTDMDGNRGKLYWRPLDEGNSGPGGPL